MNNGTNTLWYRHGATGWNKALPLGNGRLGAMVFGNASCERICLNEDTLYSGYPMERDNPEASESFRRAREMILEGRAAECTDEIDNHFAGWRSQAYLPLGDLILTMRHLTETTGLTRALDLETAVHTVAYAADGTRFLRETIASYPDQVIAVHLTAEREGTLVFDFALQPAMDATIRLGEDCCAFFGNAPTYERALRYEGHEPVYGDTDEKRGMYYYACARVRTDGTVRRAGGCIEVKGATEATLLIAARTSFAGWNRHPVLEGKPYREPCLQDIGRAYDLPWEDLKARHTADHGALYSRVSLELDGGEERFLPTDERLYAHENGGQDLNLYALYFNYARYLTIAASRPGTQATNLQGIWNDRILPPWMCNYTTNINTEMNYWPTLPVNLEECCEPLDAMLQRLAEAGRNTASGYYGMPGSCVHHNTDLWAMTEPACGSARWSFWPMALGWLSRHLFEEYEFHPDPDFLKEKVWPVLKPAAEFFRAMLVPDTDGSLILAPSSSPENTYLLGGRQIPLAKYTAMNQYIVREVFENCVRTCDLLGTEPEFAGEIRRLIPQVKMPGTGTDGRLLEYDGDYEEAEVHHRHLSHLYGIYPARLITPEENPEAAEAVRKSMLARGDESTGWAMGWRVCIWARLLDGDHAMRVLDLALRVVEGRNPEGSQMSGEVNYTNHGGCYLNLLCAHPPFQIDGNFGTCAGIAEMLVQTTPAGEIRILPALPSAWKNGSVRGLRVRGNKTVDITWRGGKATDVKIRER